MWKCTLTTYKHFSRDVQGSVFTLTREKKKWVKSIWIKMVGGCNLSTANIDGETKWWCFLWIVLAFVLGGRGLKEMVGMWEKLWREYYCNVKLGVPLPLPARIGFDVHAWKLMNVCEKKTTWFGVNAAKEVAFEGIHDMAMVHWRYHWLCIWGQTHLSLFVTMIRGDAHTWQAYTQKERMPLFYSQIQNSLLQTVKSPMNITNASHL